MVREPHSLRPTISSPKLIISFQSISILIMEIIEENILYVIMLIIVYACQMHIIIIRLCHHKYHIFYMMGNW